MNDARNGGRLGLALSGGGFRAALFHLGVLAQMAQQGLLRQVEIISTVSGGSIVGALYYLRVRTLLQSKPEQRIEDRDYVEIVQTMEVDLLEAVQRNLRMRTFTNPLKLLRMASFGYSRSDRMGELFERYLFRPAYSGPSGSIRLRDLKIDPYDTQRFRPLRDNDDREWAKVPILLLNATALNNGHNWRFEASRMGEAPRESAIAHDIDKTLRLPRPESYEKLPGKLADFSLGQAVAASACVPGLFYPLAIGRMYRGLRVQLVDGGVHDNQGLQGLLDAFGGRCDRFVVSDASGQIGSLNHPRTDMLSVLSRSNKVLTQRVREEQLFRSDETGRPHALMHLRKGFPPDTQQVDWETVEDPPSVPVPAGSVTRFGVHKQVQRHLSAIRTDLDSFSEVEAYSLMLDAYRMSELELPAVGGRPSGQTPNWRFLAMNHWIATETPAYLRSLNAGSHQVFKIFRLGPLWVAASWVLLLVALAALLFGLSRIGAIELAFEPLHVGLALVLLVGFVLVARRAQDIRAFRAAWFPIAAVLNLGRSILMLPLCLIAWIHLKTLDPLFLRLGKVDQLPKVP